MLGAAVDRASKNNTPRCNNFFKLSRSWFFIPCSSYSGISRAGTVRLPGEEPVPDAFSVDSAPGQAYPTHISFNQDERINGSLLHLGLVAPALRSDAGA